jgi:hypothetical protein
MFGVLPTYGMFVRHAKNIQFNNIQFYVESEDLRPPFLLEDVESCRIKDVMADVHNETSFIQASNINDIFIQNPTPSSACRSVIDIEGGSAKFIRISGADSVHFDKIYEIDPNLNSSEVHVN